MEHLLRDIIKGISNSYSKEFFTAIALQLDRVIQSDFIFIARLDLTRNISRTVALVNNGEVLDNFEYALEHTPCEDVANDSICIYTSQVTQTFPNDQLLIDMGIEGYLGTPLHDSDGKVMGLVVALYNKPIKDQEITLALFQLFADRIAGEFERMDGENRLKELNNTLDLKVKERTAELENTLAKLKYAHEHLVESEKMAALGNLVSGIAHEVNTPLGIAITAQSHLSEALTHFQNKLNGNGITIKDMNHFIEQQSASLPLIENNLIRAKELIENFKRIATDQSSMNIAGIRIANYYKEVLSTLNSILKKKNVQLTFDSVDEAINTYPGCHAQIITNLVSNSITHGFLKEVTDHSNNMISIKLTNIDDTYVVDYKDNGKGINKENISKVFDPFYTTARNEGCTGLGLSVCFNLANNVLNGSFICLPSEQGAHFQYRFKAL